MSYNANPQRSSVGARVQHIAPFDGTSSLSSPFTLSSSVTHSRHRGHLHARHHASHGNLVHAHLQGHQGLAKGIEEQPF